ncbi:MAG: acyl-CoA dehydrogenase family protein, partial [Gammaproteobacteria bacterium]
MDIRLSPGDLAFREEVREFLRTEYPEDIRQKVSAGIRLEREDHVRWQQILARRGWAGVNWPTEHGGTGWNPVQKHLFATECALADTPRIVPFGLSMVGPVI